jgi:hypothetical protein
MDNMTPAASGTSNISIQPYSFACTQTDSKNDFKPSDFKSYLIAPMFGRIALCYNFISQSDPAKSKIAFCPGNSMKGITGGPGRIPGGGNPAMVLLFYTDDLSILWMKLFFGIFLYP